jgi:hypothetical protein
MKCFGPIAVLVMFVVGVCPANASETAMQRLSDALDGPGFAEAGGLWYKQNEEQNAGRLRFQAPIGPGQKPVLELSVRPHCSAALQSCSERAEVWESEKLLLPYEAVAWYAFSMKLIDPIPQDDRRYVMAQWKRSIIAGAMRDYSPFLALRMRRGAMFLTVETDDIPVLERSRVCDANQLRVSNRDAQGQTRFIVAEEDGVSVSGPSEDVSCSTAVTVVKRAGQWPKATSGWNDFVFGVKTGARGGGRIEAFANGEWVVSVHGQIGHAGEGLGDHQYFKFGPYRAANDGVWTIAYSHFRRGKSCLDVASAALCDLMKADQLR